VITLSEPTMSWISKSMGYAKLPDRPASIKTTAWSHDHRYRTPTKTMENQDQNMRAGHMNKYAAACLTNGMHFSP
jgi:hypothetical protein